MSDAPVWYVVFMDSEAKGWWSVFTRPGFEHVCCFAQCPSGVIVHTYKHGRIEIRHHYGYLADDFAREVIREEGCRILKVTSQLSEDNYFRFLLYCVPLVKSCLGIRKCKALTPYGLFNYLVKQDYVEEIV